MPQALVTALTLLVVAVAGIAAIMVRVRARRRQQAGVAERGGTNVPLVAAFGAMGSHNNLNPLLALYPDRIEYRVFHLKTAAYSEVELVDARTGIGTANVILRFAGSSGTFTGNTGNRNALAHVLRQLEAKGCRLTERAKALR